MDLLNIAPPKIYSVSQLNALVHDLLENSLPEIWVEGEISNCRTYPSGHSYMSLKDDGAQIAAVLFKGWAAGIKFKPVDGLKVLARGRISSYVKRGELQFVIASLEPKEKGALQLAFEQLKAKLAGEGLFEESRKKPLPPSPQKIGIITSRQGAALHDMLSVLDRRWPGLQILIRPVAVQGDGAKDEIASAVADFNENFPDTELLLVGRGGGSIEDLWAFNEELVARAIAGSRIPIISCVGHETDFTIADFVADKRAPTPSAAAEMAVPDKSAVFERIEALASDMLGLIVQRLERLGQRLGYLKSHPFLQSPWRLYEERVRRVDELFLRLPEAIGQILRHAQKDLEIQMGRLDAFSPLKVLGRGYAIAEKLPGGEILRAAGQVKPGDRIRVRLRQGQIHCEVKNEEQ